jgi:putative phosphoesterase
MNIGLISDTHNYFDPQISSRFAGVDHILHAGDIGLPWVILQLEQIAPVSAVVGNTDVGLDFKETETVELGGRRFLLHHIVEPHRLSPSIQRRMVRENPEIVVFGHTHKPFLETIGRILFVNPGYAGKARFNLPRTLAILRYHEAEIKADFFEL